MPPKNPANAKFDFKKVYKDYYAIKAFCANAFFISVQM